MPLSILRSSLINDLEQTLRRAGADIHREGGSTHPLVTQQEAPGSSIETEIRFQEIDSAIFNRVLDFFRDAKKTVDHSKDYISVDGTRRTAKTIADPQDPQIGHQVLQTIKKQLLWSDNLALSEWGLKVAVNRETPIQILQTHGPVSPGRDKLVRSKHRVSVDLYKETIRVDLTRVGETHNDGRYFEKFEIEVELIDSMKLDSQIWINLDRVLVLLLRLVQNTVVVYTRSVRDLLIREINQILNPDSNSQTSRDKVLNHTSLVQARNLKVRDLVWGGLMGGEIKYTCTPKAEGLRKMFVIHSTGIWLIFPPREYCQLTGPLSELTGLEGTILDGEDLLQKHRKSDSTIKELHYYLPFDTIASRRSILIQKKDHLERLKICDEIRNFFQRQPSKPQSFAFGNKDFYLLGETISDFYDTISRMDAKISMLPYHTDGYMFTPNNAPYNPHSDRYRLNKRILTSYPDICKWKEPSKLTIDLRLNWRAVTDATSDGGGWLLANDNGAPKVFRGSSMNPFDPATQMNWDHHLLKGLTTGSVVELAPDFSTQPVQLFPLRIREEKPQPNRLEIAEDVWNDINNPLDHQTLVGESFALVRAYHNRVKRQLLQEIPAGSYLVDLGSGRGGDVRKWYHLERVLAVEPNLEHAKELRRRLESAVIRDGTLVSTMDQKVKIEICGGEDTTRIVEAAKLAFGLMSAPTHSRTDLPPMYISMMLSLSFFWKSISFLNQLATTIRALIKMYVEAGGRHPVEFKFLTIEGAAVRHLFQSYPNPVVLGPAQIALHDNVVKIHIVDTIVEDQTEYLVDLSQLWVLAGLQPKQIAPATDELFLSPTETVYTRLYLYGSCVQTVETPELEQHRQRLLLGAQKGYSSEYVVQPNPLKPNTLRPPQIRRGPSPPQIHLIDRKTPPSVAHPVYGESIPNRDTHSRGLDRLRVEIPNNQSSESVGVPIAPSYSLEIASVQARGDDRIEKWQFEASDWDTASTPLGGIEGLSFQVSGSNGSNPSGFNPSLQRGPPPRTESTGLQSLEMYRIATLRECGSFFHALLKNLHSDYRSRGSWYYRAELVTRLRRDLSIKLTSRNVGIESSSNVVSGVYNGVDPRNSALDDSTRGLDLGSYYYTANMGWFHNRFHSVIKAQEWLLSGGEVTLGDGLWIPEMLQINLIILGVGGTKRILRSPVSSLQPNGGSCWTLIHMCRDGTFESLASTAARSRNLQTIFSSEDEIIRVLVSSP